MSLRLDATIVAVVLAVCVPAASAGAQTTADADALKRLTLEQMLDLEVATVSRMPQRLADIPAALYVITRDDIRRAGVVALPDALRLAPGVHVARIDGARYAIGIRGFADRLARSMLVLVDGRAVYSSLFAGTYWEVQDLVLDDVERIEVIRGPGGTLWGANAVNGIINIVTRHTRDTQGTVVRGAAGNELRGLLTARHGDAISEALRYRVYAKGTGLDEQTVAAGTSADAWRSIQVGGRVDWTGQRRALTLQGDAYSARLAQRVTTVTAAAPFSRTEERDAPLAGGNLLARWSGTTASSRAFQLQAYYDRTSRDERPVAETRDTIDIDFQNQQTLADRHAVVWGLGYRRSTGRIRAETPSAFVPDRRSDDLFSAFVQDDLALVPRRLRAVAGVKVERNDYSGIEIQPSARLIWHVTAADTLVASVTRAVRTPSRVETDYTTESLVEPATPTFVRLVPNPAFRAEEIVAYEVGYRTQLGGTTYLTASGFFNDFDHMLSTELLPAVVEPGSPPRRVLPVTFANGLRGQSHGIEITGDVRPVSWWRWTGHYAYARVQMSRAPGSTDVSQERRYENLVPRHQALLRSSVDLPGAIEFDWMLRYSARLPGAVPAYATSDLRLAWHASQWLELALVGQNLHEAQHVEWAGSPSVGIQRSAFVSVTWRP